MDKLAALVALALDLCPWQPAELPHMTIYPDVIYDMLVSPRTQHSSWGITLHTATGAYIILKESTANERILCHEWRHVVEPDWRHN